MPHPGKTRTPFLTQMVASLAVVLTLALTVLVSSPELHGRLHGHDLGAANGAHHQGGFPGPAQGADDDDGCVVTLFAQGLILGLPILALASAGPVLHQADFAPFDRIFPESPRYVHLPTQAPPAGLS